MNRTILCSLAGAVVLVALPRGPALAQTGTPWIHVQVHEEGEKSSRVKVNLPLSVVRVALEVAPEKIVSQGRVQLHDHGGDLKVSDLRRIWNELRDSGEAELLSAQEGDEVVTITKRDGWLQIHVDKPSGKEVVRVDVPVPVVDALLSGEGEELNVRAAFAELEKLRGEIIRVEEKDSRVRIWIDERN